MTVSEKVAYIQGLFDGLGLDREASPEARILSEVLDVLKDVGVQLEGMDNFMNELSGDLSDLTNAVDDLEIAVFDDDEDEDGDMDGDLPLVPCPSCGEELAVDDEALAAGVVECPVCGGRFALSVEDDEDE